MQVINTTNVIIWTRSC